MSVHIDVWLRELSRAGLSPSAQQELMAQLAPTIDCRARYFPGAPRAYLARVKDLLISADSPTSPERLPRCRAWELVYLELALLGGLSSPCERVAHCFDGCHLYDGPE